MNVFVLNTGRCGSTTFIKACAHISNYTSAHESLAAHIGEARLQYPGNHIEADNRLSWYLGRLDSLYGKEAFYVHLTRNEEETAVSYARRYGTGIMEGYSKGILIEHELDETSADLARDYCHTVTKNIELFLRDKPKQMAFRLEDASRDFATFWSEIEAEGDFDAAQGEFSQKYNPSKTRDDGGKFEWTRIPKKMARIARKLPEFIRGA